MPHPATTTCLDGLLSFPVTPFDDDGGVDVGRLRAHVRHQLDAGADAVFAACGTGELFSLAPREHQLVTAEVAAEVAGAVPVFSGIGYGTALAVELARAATDAGADGLLVLPPYLLESEQEGLYAHYRTIASATPTPIVVYQRDNARPSVDTVARLAALDGVIGLKDGLGDVEQLGLVRARLGPGFPIVNGMPTAELFARAYRGLGVTGWSSAVLNFVPPVATAFRAALLAGDDARVEELLRGFFEPWARLRDEARGFAVALVKAGIDLQGPTVGAPRPPLVAPDAAQRDRLAAIVRDGLALTS